jgi:DNA-binding NarL/FixJ family response regulator
MGQAIGVVLVDDHPLIRMGASNYISQAADLDLVAQLADGNSLRDWLRSGIKADVVLLDRSLPDVDGLDLVEEIKTNGLKVIMLTIADSDAEICQAISGGVDGYVIKTSDPDQVVAAIRSVCEGRGSFPLDVMQRIARNKFNQSALGCLSAQQLKVVEFVKQGMSNKIIAYELKLSEHTVRNHICNIMEKLNLRNRVQVATLAWKDEPNRRWAY